MPDRTRPTTDDELSRPGAKMGAPGASAGSPRDRQDARSLSELAHDELCELCDDLERWLDD